MGKFTDLCIRKEFQNFGVFKLDVGEGGGLHVNIPRRKLKALILKVTKNSLLMQAFCFIFIWREPLKLNDNIKALLGGRLTTYRIHVWYRICFVIILVKICFYVITMAVFMDRISRKLQSINTTHSVIPLDAVNN